MNYSDKIFFPSRLSTSILTFFHGSMHRGIMRPDCFYWFPESNIKRARSRIAACKDGQNIISLARRMLLSVP